MDALQILNQYSKLPFSLENQFLSISVRTVMPIQANSSVSKMDDKETGGKKDFTWFHLIAQTKSNYSAVAETGELMEDNASIVTLKIKFDKKSTEGVSASRFKDFFDEHIVGKQFFTFPVLSESPTRSKSNGVTEYVKNSIDITVHPDFKLIDFIRDIEAKKAK